MGFTGNDDPEVTPMAIKVKKPVARRAPVQPRQEITPAASPTTAAVQPRPEMHRANRTDWFALLVLLGGFFVMATMNVVDMVRRLFH
jgi:hypothetical protein